MVEMVFLIMGARGAGRALSAHVGEKTAKNKGKM